MHFLNFIFVINICSVLVLLGWNPTAHSAADETDVWQISVRDSIRHDDNLFRLSDNSGTLARLPSGVSRSDTINKASLAGLLNFELSRQKILIKGEVDTNQYFNNSELDHISTDNLALWQWGFGKYFSGDIGYNYRIYQSSFTNNTIIGKDLITENSAFAKGQFAWDPNWRLRGGINWTKAQHSEESRNMLDRHTNGFLTGFDFISTANNTIGLEYQLTETSLPNLELNPVTLEDNYYLQQNIMCLVDWQFFEKTHIGGNFGYTTNSFRQFKARNFSGLTGKMDLTWEATAKTTLNLSLWRQLITAADITASYLTGQGISFTPAWMITSKIKLFGEISWESRDYAGDPGLTIGETERKDEILGGQIGIRYTPVRNADFELIYSSENRSSNLFGADYSFNGLFASILVKF
jgi:exopolysaccharide biosynthesis operon protein EpsL